MKKEIRQHILNKYNGHCAYCGCKLTLKTMQVDHIHPKAKKYNYKGEEFELLPIDNLENLNPSCRQCNFYKSSNTLEHFRSDLLTIHERVRKAWLVSFCTKYGLITINPFDGKFYFEKINKI